MESSYQSSNGKINYQIDNTWISATSTYNYLMKDPLLDWLKYHNSTFVQKHSHFSEIIKKSSNNSEYNFTSFIMEQGKLFERKVMKLISKKFGPDRVLEMDSELSARDNAKAAATVDAMQRGVPIIHGAVLHNPSNKTFGIADLLVRSDWLKFLVAESPISPDMESIEAINLDAAYHYRVIDIKFTCLLLRADATHILNSGSFPAYKAQLLIYNEALGLIQGYTPDQVYILGRRWKYVSKGETFMSNKCFDKLGTIDYSNLDHEYIDLTKRAIVWLNECRSPASEKWDILNYPLARWELYPNMCNDHDYPWHDVKKQISDKTKELTCLWMVGPKNRSIALENNICQWTDKDCIPKKLGINGEKTGKILQAIININQSDKKLIQPNIIHNNLHDWKIYDKIEFFVDFETYNGVLSSIKKLPEANTSNLIFMIGVGYLEPETGKWIYRDFTSHLLSLECEGKVCQDFSNYILDISKKYGVIMPRCIHWAKAEDNMWNGAMDRHPLSNHWKSWEWKWMDLLEIFKEEPIVIHGCMSFGLKDVANAMKTHGFIQSSWDKNNLCSDGQSAMIAAKKAHDKAKYTGKSMAEINIMKQIQKYNQVDVRVLYEIIAYLRKNHTSKRKNDDRKNSHDKNSHNNDSYDEPIINSNKRSRRTLLDLMNDDI